MLPGQGSERYSYRYLLQQAAGASFFFSAFPLPWPGWAGPQQFPPEPQQPPVLVMDSHIAAKTPFFCFCSFILVPIVISPLKQPGQPGPILFCLPLLEPACPQAGPLFLHHQIPTRRGAGNFAPFVLADYPIKTLVFACWIFCGSIGVSLLLRTLPKDRSLRRRAKCRLRSGSRPPLSAI